MSRNCTSLKNDGRLPSMAWPMNWPIQAMTKMTRQVSHSGHGEGVEPAHDEREHAERDGGADAERDRQREVVDDGERDGDRGPVEPGRDLRERRGHGNGPEEADDRQHDGRHADHVQQLVAGIAVALAVFPEPLLHGAHGAERYAASHWLCKNREVASMPLMQRIMRFMSRSGILSDARLLELYPPFMPMRIKVLEISEQWRTVRILLPLNARSRNPGGVMFGGYQAALADPIAALACARVFPGYSVWTRAMTISFDHGGNSDLEMRFSLTPEQEKDIRIELESEGRSTPTFEYGYFRKDGVRCTVIRNTVAIRPRGYKRATSPPASPENWIAVD